MPGPDHRPTRWGEVDLKRMDFRVSNPELEWCAWQLRQAHAQAQRTHVSLEVGYDDFSRNVVERAVRRLRAVAVSSSPETLKAVLRRMWLCDLYLVIACELRTPRAWPSFTDAYFARLRGLARHHGAPEPDVVSRELIGDLSLPPRRGTAQTMLGTYQGHGSLFAWLSVVLRRRLADRGRAHQRNAAPHAAVRAAANAGPPLDPSDALIDAETAAHLVGAFQEAWNTLSAQERVALLYKYRDELTQRQIARLLDVSESRVSRIVRQAIAKIRTAVLARFRGEDLRQWESRRALWGCIAASLSNHLSRTEPVRETPPREGGTTVA